MTPNKMIPKQTSIEDLTLIYEETGFIVDVKNNKFAIENSKEDLLFKIKCMKLKEKNIKKINLHIRRTIKNDK